MLLKNNIFYFDKNFEIYRKLDINLQFLRSIRIKCVKNFKICKNIVNYEV